MRYEKVIKWSLYLGIVQILFFIFDNVQEFFLVDMKHGYDVNTELGSKLVLASGIFWVCISLILRVIKRKNK